MTHSQKIFKYISEVLNFKDIKVDFTIIKESNNFRDYKVALYSHDSDWRISIFSKSLKLNIFNYNDFFITNVDIDNKGFTKDEYFNMLVSEDHDVPEIILDSNILKIRNFVKIVITEYISELSTIISTGDIHEQLP